MLTAVPLLASATPAAVCGTPDTASVNADAAHVQPATTRTARTSAAVHHGHAKATFDPLAIPKEVLAGGPRAKIGGMIYNGTGAAFDSVRPTLGLYAWTPVGNPDQRGNGKAVSLAPKDVTVEVYHQGRWQKLGLSTGCDPVIGANTGFLLQDLPSGHNTRFLFRFSIAATAARQLKSVQVHFGAWSERGYEDLVTRTIPLVHGN
ncbi:hypothetical protein GCM10009753_01250 [Streptantibioticus ferralitis]